MIGPMAFAGIVTRMMFLAHHRVTGSHSRTIKLIYESSLIQDRLCPWAWPEIIKKTPNTKIRLSRLSIVKSVIRLDTMWSIISTQLSTDPLRVKISTTKSPYRLGGRIALRTGGLGPSTRIVAIRALGNRSWLKSRIYDPRPKRNPRFLRNLE